MKRRRLVTLFAALLLAALPLLASGEAVALTVRVYGAQVQTATEKGQPSGSPADAVQIGAEGSVYITAAVPPGQKLAYWVINGVRYDFTPVPSRFAVLDIDRDLTIEAVCKGAAPVSLLSEAAIQEARTGEPLKVEAVIARLCHMKNDKKGGGGWIKEFDFTQDYVNRATKAQEKGGQISAMLKANAMDKSRLIGWYFDTMQFRVGAVKSFVVHHLNTSMLYKPIYVGVRVEEPEEPETHWVQIPGTVWWPPNNGTTW